VYDKLATGGMKCTEDMITFLSEMKNRPACNSGATRVFNSNKGSSIHQEDCSTRHNWMPAMELLHIQLMTAMRLLKLFLKYFDVNVHFKVQERGVKVMFVVVVFSCVLWVVKAR
jgi:hypothetical protein